MQDRDGAFQLLAGLRERFSTITLIWANGGYAGRLVSRAHQRLVFTLTIVKRSDDTTGFVVLPRRWVVERTFGWLMRYRRLSATMNDDPTTTKPWCSGPPSRSRPGNWTARTSARRHLPDGASPAPQPRHPNDQINKRCQQALT